MQSVAKILPVLVIGGRYSFVAQTRGQYDFTDAAWEVAFRKDASTKPVFTSSGTVVNGGTNQGDILVEIPASETAKFEVGKYEVRFKITRTGVDSEYMPKAYLPTEKP